MDFYIHSFQKPTPKEIIEIDIDLDVPDKNRWDPVLEKFEKPIKTLIKRINARLPKFLNVLFEKLHDASIGGDYIHHEYAQYEGMAEKLNVPVVEVMLYNFIYEVTEECFGIVAQNEDGDIILGRNLDYRMVLRNVTYQANFYREGEFLYSAMMLAGYTGSFSAMKPGKFAIALTARLQDYFLRSIIPAVKRVMGGEINVGYLIRKIMEEAETYEEALEMLKSTPLVTKGFFLIAGTEEGQGAIVTRNETHAEDVWELDPDSPTDWAITITNYDRDDPRLMEDSECKCLKRPLL